MGNNRPVKTKDFEKFLEAHGCSFKGNSKGSHAKWKCPNCWRTIVIRGNYKDIPAFHLQTNLSTMGFTMEYVYDWIDKNC